MDTKSYHHDTKYNFSSMLKIDRKPLKIITVQIGGEGDAHGTASISNVGKQLLVSDASFILIISAEIEKSNSNFRMNVNNIFFDSIHAPT